MSVPGAQHVVLARVEANLQCYPQEGAACADLDVRLGGMGQEEEPAGSDNQ